MPLKIIRNDITKMDTQAIVNTANDQVVVGPGCDLAVYKAAGYDRLLSYRREKIGIVQEGESFLTPAYDLPAKYIVHTVSPLYIDGKHDEEKKLRACYKNSLALAKEHGITEIAFPLISTGSFGYPKEEGMRIAVDEINSFLLNHEMTIILVVFDEKATRLGTNLFPDLESYIDQNYVSEKKEEEYGDALSFIDDYEEDDGEPIERSCRSESIRNTPPQPNRAPASSTISRNIEIPEFLHTKATPIERPFAEEEESVCAELDFESEHEDKLKEQMKHLSDTFSQYLLYLIQNKNMENAEVYKRAIVDKKTFSKIKNNVDYHPQKITALCFCIGAKLNLDESKDLLARAGYALSPCDKTDIIFSYFIENSIYDMIELDIQLEEHGLPCIIS